MLNAFFFIAAILVIAIIVGSLAAYAEAKRRKALLELAQSMGFQFTPTVGVELIKQFPNCYLFSCGTNQLVSNLLSGETDSTQVKIFDWRYVTGSGKNATTHLTTVFAVQSVDLNLPSFYCRPESVFDWLGLTFDGRDIDFEDRPLFSKRFHLHGNDESRIRQLFDVDVCEFFEQHDGCYAEGQRNWLIYYHHGKQIVPAKIPDQFKDAFALYVLMKGSSAESAPAVSDQGRDEMPPESEREF